MPQVSPVSPAIKSGDKMANLADALASLDQNTLQRTLERALGLNPMKVSELMADPNLEGLCVAMRAIDADPQLATRVLVSAHMVSVRDMRLIKRLEEAYSLLNSTDCKRALNLWQIQYPHDPARAAKITHPPTEHTQQQVVETSGLRGTLNETPTATARSASPAIGNRRNQHGLASSPTLHGEGYVPPTHSSGAPEASTFVNNLRNR